MYQQQQPKRSGPGIGTAVAAGGAGLLGGVLLTEAFENHEDNEEREAYQDGALRFLDSCHSCFWRPRCLRGLILGIPVSSVTRSFTHMCSLGYQDGQQDDYGGGDFGGDF